MTATYTSSDLFKQVRAQANRVIADETTRRRHPSFITKAIGREHLNRLNGAVELVLMLHGDLNDDTQSLVRQAREAAGTWL